VIDNRHPGHGYVSGGLRFLTELIAWVAVPWALWPHSTALAVGAVVLLIGLPAVLSTPGDRPGGSTLVSVPGVVTILLVLMQLAAATAAAWVLWPWWAAASVTVLCVIVTVTEQPRWRWLLSSHGDPIEAQPGGVVTT
jgi:membrane protein YdbS with pleckstrin-like domain